MKFHLYKFYTYSNKIRTSEIRTSEELTSGGPPVFENALIKKFCPIVTNVPRMLRYCNKVTKVIVSMNEVPLDRTSNTCILN